MRFYEKENLSISDRLFRLEYSFTDICARKFNNNSELADYIKNFSSDVAWVSSEQETKCYRNQKLLILCTVGISIPTFILGYDIEELLDFAENLP